MEKHRRGAEDSSSSPVSALVLQAVLGKTHFWVFNFLADETEATVPVPSSNPSNCLFRHCCLNRELTFAEDLLYARQTQVVSPNLPAFSPCPDFTGWRGICRTLMAQDLSSLSLTTGLTTTRYLAEHGAKPVCSSLHLCPPRGQGSPGSRGVQTHSSWPRRQAPASGGISA